jgi:RNA-directed DNA polymerase
LRIRKKDGTWRKLHNPDTQMRTVQYRILTKLLNRLTLPEYVYAFEKNRNIPTMAALHVNKYCIISVDIKDFFHSIKQSTLFNIFCRLGIGELPARTLSELCTYKAFVPQGALTSPKVSNLITSVTFGPEINNYCAERNYTLTIYADDVTISTNDRDINPRQVIQEITRIIHSHEFRINKRKTKVMYHGSRQYVCGAVVNAKVNLIVKERKKLRAIIHNVTKNGIEAEATKSGMEPSKFLNFLRGRVNWFRQLNPIMGQKYFDQLKVYLVALKVQVEKDAEVALLYKAYMEEIDRTILEEPITLPWE